jgi:hypothetical protein
VLYNSPIVGQFKVGAEQIHLGDHSLDGGEGGYLMPLFHEYQHYVFHSLNENPARDDIAWLFYNELSAYFFERILGSYLPASFYPSGHADGFTQIVRQSLTTGEPYDAMSKIRELMETARGEDKPLYPYMKPLADHYIQEDDLFEAIDESFSVDGEKAKDLRDEARTYFERYPWE